MTIPRHPVMLGTALVALALPAAAGATGLPFPPYVPPAPIATVWAGWDAPATVGVGRPTSVAASDRTIMVVGAAPTGGSYPFRLEGPSGRRIGRVPGETAPQLGIAGERRLYATDGCTVRTSTDRGATWSAAGLPGCTSAQTQGIDTGIAVLDDRIAWVANTSGTWRTTDGGTTWFRSSSSTTLPVPASADVAYRLTPGIRLGFALERTTDGGATWTQLSTPFPDAAGTPSNAGGGATLLSSSTGAPPLVVRADGALLVGNGDRIVQSDDRGETFTQHLLPKSLAEPGLASPTVEQIVCDEASRCTVGVAGAPGIERRGIRYVDGAFDDRDFALVAAPPRYRAVDAGYGRIVGLDGDPRTDAVGAPVLLGSFTGLDYDVIARGDDVTGDVGTSGVLAVPTSTGAATTAVTVSTDHGRVWDEKPSPASATLGAAATLRRIALLPGDFRTSVALSSRNRLAWSQDLYSETDLGRLGAQDLAVSRGVAIVVGAGGISRVASPTSAVASVASRVVRGRSFEHVEARGGTVVAWGGGRRPYAVRSSDGGTTWAQTTLPAGVNAVEVATDHVVYALAGRTLHRSRDGGRTFTRRVVTPELGVAGLRFDGDAPARLAFSSADRGALITPSGAFVTADGGGGVSPIPTPGAVVPSIAEVARGTVTIQDAISGAILRSPGLLDRPTPSLVLRAVGRPRRGARGVRSVVVAGRLSGVGADEPVALVGYRSRAADRPLLGIARTDATGRFRAPVRLSAVQRGVQAWFRGAVTTDRTARSKTSAVLRVR